MKPLVSVIIPTYNREKYITRAIESVLQQTEQNVEVIVVDDASNDTTTEIVQRYCSDRLKLIVNERNQGPSYSRNRGIKEAKGEWIALLDSDDWYAPNRLEKLLQVARAENADFVADDLYLIADDAKKPWSTRFSEKLGFGSRPARFKNITQINALDFVELDLGLVKPIIKRNFLVQHQLNFNEELRYGEDFQLFVKSLLTGAKFIVVPQPYYFYYSHSNSLVTNYIECQEQMYISTANILQEEAIENNQKLIDALKHRQKKLDRGIKTLCSYRRVTIPLKQGKLSTAITEMLRNPLFFRYARLEILRRLNHLGFSLKDKFSNREKVSSDSTA
ncbi:MAG TPA: hypothetical protein DEV81_24975 [Cyanobacteria bacterium UBA11049]|nr:hypothetical protein [Cyanobacteria bacterium UBA11049]